MCDADARWLLCSNKIMRFTDDEMVQVISEPDSRTYRVSLYRRDIGKEIKYTTYARLDEAIKTGEEWLP